jgi:hypothetical protein
MGFLRRAHLPRTDCGAPNGAVGGSRSRPANSSRSADCATCRSSPFVNKLDREGRDPFDLLDEIERSPALDLTAAARPIGMGRDFLGTYDLFADALLLFEGGVHVRVVEPVYCRRPRRPEIAPGCCRKPRSPNCAITQKLARSCPRSGFAFSARLCPTEQ